jgi:hypothetical protein
LSLSFHTMSNFNKFLQFNEELRLVIKLRSKNLFFYVLMFIGFPMAFFMLYPMSIRGRQGFGLWLTLIIILIVVVVQNLLKQADCYLLTNQRLIHLKLKNKADYQHVGEIKLSKINKITRKGLYSICLQSKKRKFYLTNIKDRDLIYKKLIRIRKQNLV